ncbi:hypothetical protein VNI00_011094 [Paramarasmius palmivorus]|uniref:Uncharacterized protein n=1 Tax=Paramarasmius palmivorus TaxID=297713 RepID=A0AAW0CH47_9AGAR
MSRQGLAATTPDGRWVVTTADSCYIPKPDLDRRRLHQRLDYSFGEDDPLLFPQLYLRQRCHWSVIARKPMDPADTRRRWWDMLARDHFEEAEGSMSGLGRWKEGSLDIFKEDYIALRRRAREHEAARVQIGSSPNMVVSILLAQLDNTLGYLLHVTVPFKQAQQLLCRFQRWFLELTAALDWIEVFRPIMEGKRSKGKDSVDRVGTFTGDLVEYKQLHSAGIPTWHIRPIAEKSFVGFDKQYKDTQFTTPDMMGIEKRVIENGRCLYEGSWDTVSRAVAMENYLRALTSMENPFGACFPEPPQATEHLASSSKPPQNTLPERPSTQVHSHRHQPYKKLEAKPKKDQIFRDKFTEITTPYSPFVPPFWVQALGSIDKSKRPPKDEVPNSGYVFPDPGLFLAASPDKLDRYLRKWLDLRDILSFRVMMRSPCLASVAWSPTQWRTLLALTDAYPSKPNSQMQLSRNAVDRLLGECMKFYGIRRREDALVVKEYHFTWRGVQYPIGRLHDPKIVKEIVWELYELNFRHEFHALDIMIRRQRKAPTFGEDPWGSMYQAGNASDTCHDEVQTCFPGNKTSCPSEIYWDVAAEGVAADSLASRIPWILCMKKVLKTWPGSEAYMLLQTDRERPEQFTDTEALDLEKSVALFYCQSFYNKFGRPPIIPHCLHELNDGHNR